MIINCKHSFGKALKLPTLSGFFILSAILDLKYYFTHISLFSKHTPKCLNKVT